MTLSSRAALRLAALAVVPLLAVSACGSDDSGDSGDSGSGGAKASQATCSYPDDTLVPKAAKPNKKPPSEPAYKGKVDVTITTNQGAIPFVLDADNAPCAVNSVLSLAKQKYYDNSPCNRVAYQSQGFAILQCGDPTGTGTGGPGYTMKEEVTGKETYGAGVIAMAKRQDPASTGGQFFIMFAPTQLPPEYTVLGKVADKKGLAVILKAAKAALKGKQDGYDGKTATPIIVKSITES